MESFFKDWTLRIAMGVESAAALIIALAAIQATVQALLQFWKGGSAGAEAVRLRLGRWLALALEFELAADILRTAVAPTWTEIGQLASIVVLRTALNYFLQKEIDKAAERGAPAAAPAMTEQHRPLVRSGADRAPVDSSPDTRH